MIKLDRDVTRGTTLAVPRDELPAPDPDNKQVGGADMQSGSAADMDVVAGFDADDADSP